MENQAKYVISAHDPVKVMALHEAAIIMNGAVSSLRPAQYTDEVAEITINMARLFEAYIRELR